jgi:uncharacterized membrane protein
MHIHPIAFIIVGALLGVGIFASTRRSEKGQRRFRILMFGLLLILAALLAVDFITTPGERWVSGICLLGALLALG